MKRSRGFAVISAIFLLVVLGGLAAVIVSVSTTQQLGSALDVQGARAYHAARAGIEWGINRVWNSNPSCRMGTEAYCTSTAPAACPAAASFAPTAPTLAGFRVTVSCTDTPDPVGGPTIFTVTAVACNQPDATGNCPDDNPNVGNSTYVERRVTVVL